MTLAASLESAVGAAPEGVSSIAILDCGGQYTKVIDRRIRELAVHSEILPLDIDPADLAGFDAIILSGGPESVYSDSAPRYRPGLLDTGKPILGICYGMQLLAAHFGGRVVATGQAEYGVEEITVDADCPLFSSLEPVQKVLMSHGDSVAELPEGFVVSGRSEHAVAAFWHPGRRIHGVQFHPEVDLTANGATMLENFVDGVAGLERNYRLADRIDGATEAIRAQVGASPVVVLVSGGVDSAVTAALLLRALPAGQVHALHVDTGFMRKDESEEVVQELKGLGLQNLRHVRASDRFFNTGSVRASGDAIPPLTELYDPELKRELVGTLFMDVLREELERLDLDFERAIFAQGTLRPDLIESGNPGVSSVAHSIKTHHNDVPLVRAAREQGRVVETNADWHKDEVRQVARELGLSEAIASRQPFPGPGLVLRVVTWDGRDLPPADLDDRIGAFLADRVGGISVRTLPFRTVGVQGDHRSHRFLTLAAADDLDQPGLNRIGQLVPGAFSEVNRLAVVAGSRVALDALVPRRSTISESQVDLLREVDAVVRQELADLPSSQTFCVLLPLGAEAHRYSVAIRSFITSDYMTGRHAQLGADLPVDRLTRCARWVLEAFPDVDMVVYDVTGKPPATVEWQ